MHCLRSRLTTTPISENNDTKNLPLTLFELLRKCQIILKTLKGLSYESAHKPLKLSLKCVVSIVLLFKVHHCYSRCVVLVS